MILIKRNLCGLENHYMLAIGDGHGANGHLVSKHIKKQIVPMFEFEDKRFCKHKLKERNIDSIFELDPKSELKIF
jgi:hypothetical protein